MDESKTSAPGSAEPQLRNACLSFWSVEAELGLRVPGKEGPVFLKIWYNSSRRSFTQPRATASALTDAAPADSST